MSFFFFAYAGARLDWRDEKRRPLPVAAHARENHPARKPKMSRAWRNKPHMRSRETSSVVLAYQRASGWPARQAYAHHVM